VENRKHGRQLKLLGALDGLIARYDETTSLAS